MKKISLFLATLSIALGVFVFAPVASVSAAPVDVFKEQCYEKDSNGKVKVDSSGNPIPDSNANSSICAKQGSGDLLGVIKNIINVLLTIGGVVAVIMIIVGGIRFMVSTGDQSKIKAARDTILYSVIGLVVTILAFAIVNFVIDKL